MSGIFDIFDRGEIQKLTELINFLKSESYLTLDYEVIRCQITLKNYYPTCQMIKQGKEHTFAFNFYLDSIGIQCHQNGLNADINIEINGKRLISQYRIKTDDGSGWADLGDQAGMTPPRGYNVEDIMPFNIPVKCIYKNPWKIQFYGENRDLSDDIKVNVYFFGFKLPDSKVNI